MVKEGYKETEIGVIPEDWNICQLGDVVSFKNGVAHENSISQNGRYIVVNSKFVSTEGNVKKYSNLCLQPCYENDILMVMSDVPNGRAIAKCFYVSENGLYTLNQRICALTPKTSEAKYIYYAINRHPYFLSFDDGVKQTNLTKNNILECKLCIPANDEQQKIAEALSDMDSLISSLEKLIEKKKAIKQGTMQELLTGKKRLPGFSGEWQKRFLGDLCTICRGGSPRPIQNFLTTDTNGINWIKIGDVGANDKYINSTAEKIKESGASMSRRVYKGDFLLSNSMSFGRPYILNIDGCIHDGWLTIQNYQENFDVNYLYYFLGSEFVKEQYVQMAAGSSVQNLNKEKVSKLVVYTPTIKEQTAIATILSDMDAEITALEQKLAKCQKLKQGMMQQLLTGKVRLI